jgi:hypothetical protein
MTYQDNFSKIIRTLRWSLILYYPGLVILALAALAGVGYGLAHAGDQAFAKVFGILGMALLVLAAPPLALLVNHKGALIRTLQVIAIIEIVPVFGAIGYVLFLGIIQPQLWKADFKYKTRGIEIIKVNETPYVRPDLGTGNTALGIIMRAEVRLPDDLTLDRNGEAVLQGLEQTLYPYAPQSADKNSNAPFTSIGRAVVNHQDRPINELPGFADIGNVSKENRVNIKLPAGLYQVTRVLLLPGLSSIASPESTTNPEGVVCKTLQDSSNHNGQPQQATHLSQLTDSPLSLQFIATLSLKYRLGYVSISRSANMHYRYQHQAWIATFQALTLQSCDEIATIQKQKKVALEQQQQKESDQQAYLRGDIANDRGPLYEEACAGNTEAIHQRMMAEKPQDAAWMPQMPLYRLLINCTIKEPRLTIFKQLAPAAYLQATTSLNKSTQEQNQEELCRLIGDLHQNRQLDFLEALVSIKLPIDCEGKQIWRKGIMPTPPAGSKLNHSDENELLKATISRDDNVSWVNTLIKAGIDLCPPQMVNPKAKYPQYTPPLLTIITPHFSPELISLVISSGCDPRLGAAPQLTQDRGYTLPLRDTISPSIMWTLRRHRTEHDALTSPISNGNINTLTKLDRQMQVSANELNGPIYDSYGSVFYNLRARILNSSPRLLVTLLNAGANPNAGLPLGETWFSPFYDTHIGSNSDQHAPAIDLLDVLTQEQLKQVLNQAPMHIDDIGKKLTALRKPNNPKYDTAPLRDYICQRKALPCH